MRACHRSAGCRESLLCSSVTVMRAHEGAGTLRCDAVWCTVRHAAYFILLRKDYRFCEDSRAMVRNIKI
jgi:hypothetical protein